MEKLNFGKQPKLKTELLQDFYQFASATYKLAPWKHCSDADVFGVLIPGTKELHFVSVMGGGGQCFGLATYRGFTGLQLFLAVLGGFGEDDPTAARRKQDGLLMEFVNKKFLDEDDLAIAKRVNFKPADAKSWVFVRDMMPGWHPWGAQDKDLVALSTIMSILPEFVELQKKDPDWTCGDGEDVFPVFVYQKSKKKWALQWWNDEKIMKTSEPLDPSPALTPANELHLQSSKRLKQVKKTTWEACTFFAPEPVLEGDRPFFPEICVLMDRKTQQCLGMEMFPPTQNRAAAIRDLALATMIKTAIRPEVVAIEVMELLAGAITLQEALEVAVKVEPTPAAHDFRAGLFESMQQDPEFS